MVLHPKPALMNHSCDPNAFVRFDVPSTTLGKKSPPYGSISVLALRQISKHEEVKISYVDPTFPFDKRQEELKCRYFFDCACSSCVKGPNTPMDRFHLTANAVAAGHGQESIEPMVREVGKQAEQYLLSLQSKSILLHTQVDNIKQVMKQLADTGIWPLYRYPYPQLRQELQLGLMAQNRYLEALLHSATITRPVDLVLYPQEHHPLRLMQEWTFINICLHCLKSIVMKEETQEEIRFETPMLGLLGCVMVDDSLCFRNENTQCATGSGALNGYSLGISLRIGYPSGCSSTACQRKYLKNVDRHFGTSHTRLKVSVTLTNGQRINITMEFCSLTENFTGKCAMYQQKILISMRLF